MENALERRTRRCQAEMEANDVVGVVLAAGSNMLYLSGFSDEPSERHLLLLLPRDGDPVFVAPTMYREQIEGESWVSDVRTWDDSTGPRPILESVLRDLPFDDGTVLLDDAMWATFVLDLRSLLPDATFGLASDVLDPLRMEKDDRELSAMREAGALTDEVSEAIRTMGADAVGMTERELADEIDRRLREAGASGPAFETIVGSGPNGAHPHHRRSDRVIEPGDPVVLDFGGSVDGYPADQTRTVVFDGSPPAEFEDVHETVHDALEAGVDAVEPGVTAESIDAAARSVIEEGGYGERFTHRTGHGVGLDVHEAPFITDGNETELRPGMVFSVEPGVYLPGEFGVRIEDLIVVTDDGCDRLNHSPRGWEPL
ncbi:aminopeptidase P family protein [Halostella sp. JP-L12]|uniref:M24 family metallopeptidase n=1 Tax=Halostella TaxID=1843185 RepID=UPI000EF77D70|nr:MULTISPECIES: Xaa-Pro peptidase family protein [Halostella]NHN49404.1 aminopeptidase P family protein [Halostella sp. JP-L12]